MKNESNYSRFIQLGILFTLVILFASCFATKAYAKTKTKATLYEKEFIEQDISYTIDQNDISWSARSDKYTAHLYIIDGKAQILYSKNGKKISKSNIEEKVARQLGLNSDTVLIFYHMAQYDNKFYISFASMDYEELAKSYYYGGGQEYTYYVAETGNFKSYKIYKIATQNSEVNLNSVVEERICPMLYKSGDMFYFMYYYNINTVSLYNDNSFFSLTEPIGYYGKSLDKMKKIYFDEAVDFDSSRFTHYPEVQIHCCLEKSKLQLFVHVSYSQYEKYPGIEKISGYPELYEYEADLDKDKGVKKWQLAAVGDCLTMYRGDYENFYTIFWTNEKGYNGQYGVAGQDGFRFNFPDGSGDGSLSYGCAVDAKKDKKGNLNIRSSLYVPTDDSDAYWINKKGKSEVVELPFDRENYAGCGCTSSIKGWNAIVSDGYVFISKDGFLSCKAIALPCSEYDFIDIEAYGNYLYVISSNKLYKLPVSKSLLTVPKDYVPFSTDSSSNPSRKVTEPDAALAHYHGKSIELGSKDGEPLKWDVLCRAGNKYLLLCSEPVAVRPYFAEDQFSKSSAELPEYGWDESDIKRWLNNEFLDTCLKDEKDYIMPKADENVFLLSKQEYENYGYNIPDIEEKWLLRDVLANGYQGYVVENGTPVSEDLYLYSITELWNDSGDEPVVIRRYHFETDFEYAIRPAIWVKVSEFSEVIN